MASQDELSSMELVKCNIIRKNSSIVPRIKWIL
jgi:hypothetical protein